MSRPLITSGGIVREIADGASLTVPPAGSLPGSPAQGDAVVLTTDGLLYVYDESAWVAGGVTSQQLGGFISEDAANYYELSAAGAMPGAANFVAVAMAVSLANRNAAAFEPIFSKIDGAVSTGWYIAWSYGQVEAYCATTGADITIAIPTSTYNPQLTQGHMLCVGLRVFSSGGDVTAELWIGPSRYGTQVDSGTTVVSNTGNAGRALATALGGAGPANAIFAGIGYYAGTVTTAQMRTIMGRCVAQSRIPEDAIAWTSVYQGQDVDTAPATWTPSVGTGTMSEVGTCEGVAGFFPPGAAGNNVIVGAGGGGLSDYETRRRILLLG